MREIGAVVRLQIQRSSLKTGEKPQRVYDPSPVLSVRRLAVGGDGVLGEGEDRSWLVDVHHRAHPQTKNPDGGPRGFYCRGEGAGIVSLGDRLVLVER